MFCELYEAIIDGIPVTCQIIEFCHDTGKYHVQYADKDAGVLRKWIDGATMIKTPKEEISQ